MFFQLLDISVILTPHFGDVDPLASRHVFQRTDG